MKRSETNRQPIRYRDRPPADTEPNRLFRDIKNRLRVKFLRLIKTLAGTSIIAPRRGFPNSSFFCARFFFSSSKIFFVRRISETSEIIGKTMSILLLDGRLQKCAKLNAKLLFCASGSNEWREVRAPDFFPFRRFHPPDCSTLKSNVRILTPSSPTSSAIFR